MKYKTARVVKDSYDPKGIGERSEAAILATLLLAGKAILKPFGDNLRYDLAVDKGEGKFLRIQCKTGQMMSDNSFSFPSSRMNWNSSKRHNYIGEADIFAVYLRENKQIYIFDVNTCPKTMCSVRFKYTKHSAKNRMAEDHLFDSSKSLFEYIVDR